MITRKDFNLALRRFLIILGISFVLVFVGSEVVYPLVRNDYDRAPQVVELVIPAGTAELVAEGQEVEGIPAELIFIVGDDLKVVNEDDAPHELGPLFIPPGTSATMRLEDASAYEYSCSFRPTEYLGLTVREGLTLNVRLISLGYVAPATAIFIFVYSLVLYPLVPDLKKEKPA
jgi:hypothetical protein